MSLPPE
ncbi:hypothetical protein E2C01_090233 [Portunus trituberculatus]|nr:hypothetical protein [Portunus trituberculatus]